MEVVKEILRKYKEELERKAEVEERKERLVEVFRETFEEDPEEVGFYTNGTLYAKRIYVGDDEILALVNEIVCLHNRIKGGYFRLSSIGEVEVRVSEERKKEESDWRLVREFREESEYGTTRYCAVFEKTIPGYSLSITVYEKWSTDC